MSYQPAGSFGVHVPTVTGSKVAAGSTNERAELYRCVHSQLGLQDTHQVHILPNPFSMEGHCLCGAITVRIHDSELFVRPRSGHYCHCRNCRRVAGGLFGANLAIEKEKVEIIGEDSLAQYVDTDTSSGTPMARCFCKHCGT